MRIHIRPRKTILSSTVVTTTLLPFDLLIEEYLKKTEKDRFDDWYQRKSKGHGLNFIFLLCFFHVLFTLLLRSYCQ